MLLAFQPEILFRIFFFCGQSCVKKINILDFVALQKLYEFFRAELSQYLTPELNPKGREIIEACLRGASVEVYESLISRD